MEKREPRVYYLAEREDRKAVLIFDGGYAGGDIHIYEHKESRETTELEEEMKQYYQNEELPKEVREELVALWIEKNLGYAMSWKLVSS